MKKLHILRLRMYSTFYSKKYPLYYQQNGHGAESGEKYAYCFLSQRAFYLGSFNRLDYKYIFSPKMKYIIIYNKCLHKWNKQKRDRKVKFLFKLCSATITRRNTWEFSKTITTTTVISNNRQGYNSTAFTHFSQHYILTFRKTKSVAIRHLWC